MSMACICQITGRHPSEVSETCSCGPCRGYRDFVESTLDAYSNSPGATAMTPEQKQLLGDAKAAYLLKQRTVLAIHHDAAMRAALAVAIEAAAKVLDERHEYYQQLALQLGLDTTSDFAHADRMAVEDASAIRALLPARKEDRNA